MKNKQNKKIILDASSAILLAKTGFHEILTESYATIMSDSVYAEITGNNLPGSGEYRTLRQKKRVEVCSIRNSPPWSAMESSSLQKLDRGERDTILLFHDGHGDFVVTDDGAAARFCVNKRIPFVNALLLLRLLHHAELIGEYSYETGFKSLLSLGRYTQKIIDFARGCPDNELAFFLP